MFRISKKFQLFDSGANFNQTKKYLLLAKYFKSDKDKWDWHVITT